MKTRQSNDELWFIGQKTVAVNDFRVVLLHNFIPCNWPKKGICLVFGRKPMLNAISVDEQFFHNDDVLILIEKG